MPQVAVEIGGRTYRLACGDGDEDRVRELAAYVNGKVQELSDEFGQMAPERLMLMAAMLIADDLWDVRMRSGESAEAPAKPDPELGDATMDTDPAEGPDDVENV